MKITKRNKLILNITLFIVTLCIFFPPALKLWSAVTVTNSFYSDDNRGNLADSSLDIDKFRKPEVSEYYSSKHFEFYISKNYMALEEINNYIDWIEGRYLKVLEYMNYEDAINEDDKKIKIYIVDSNGTSYCGGLYFVIYELMSGLDVSVHEMTHALDFKLARGIIAKDNKNSLHEDFSNLFFEQRAVFIENKLGSGMAFPNYGLPVNPIIYSRLRNRTKLESLYDLNKKVLLMEYNQYDTSEFRYVMAGSLGHFLIEEYGVDTHHEIITKGYKGAYNKSLLELEQEWLSWLNTSSIIQNLIMVFASIVLLLIAHLWLLQKGRYFWLMFPSVITGILAFLSWGYYLSYDDNDLWGLVLAIVLGALVKLWKTKIGVAILWISGFVFTILPLIIIQ